MGRHYVSGVVSKGEAWPAVAETAGWIRTPLRQPRILPMWREAAPFPARTHFWPDLQAKPAVPAIVVTRKPKHPANADHFISSREHRPHSSPAARVRPREARDATSTHRSTEHRGREERGEEEEDPWFWSVLDIIWVTEQAAGTGSVWVNYSEVMGTTDPQPKIAATKR